MDDGCLGLRLGEKKSMGDFEEGMATPNPSGEIRTHPRTQPDKEHFETKNKCLLRVMFRFNLVIFWFQP